MMPARPAIRTSRDRPIMGVAIVVTVQMMAALFFIADALGDVVRDGMGGHVLVEGMIAFALLAGVLFGSWQVRAMLLEARRRDEALAIASGALADHIQAKFQQWRLTPAESDVALFMLKGFDVGEIAALRGAAEGTVRAQLARVYAKAGVNNRGAFFSLFFDELLDNNAQG
mgnify:CR=1 FL=1